MFRIPDSHDNFSLSKKEQDDQTIGLVNPKPIVCKFCNIQLIGKKETVKVARLIDLIKNHMREYEAMNTYWRLDNFDKFSNIEVHGIQGDIKYLCCLNCQSEILGFQFISGMVDETTENQIKELFSLYEKRQNEKLLTQDDEIILQTSDENQFQDNSNINLQFEMQSIFSLADFIQMLSRSQVFDIASRIFKMWQQEKLQGALNDLTKLVNQGLMFKAFQKLKSLKKSDKYESMHIHKVLKNLSLSQIKDDSQEYQISSGRKRNSKHKSSILFERLYQEGKELDLKRDILQKSQIESMINKELAQCTFSPKIRKHNAQSHGHSSSRKCLHDLKSQQEIDLQKCTFQPDLSKSTRHQDSTRSRNRDIFRKLYSEAQILKQEKAYLRQEIEQTKQLECPFSPDTRTSQKTFNVSKKQLRSASKEKDLAQFRSAEKDVLEQLKQSSISKERIFAPLTKFTGQNLFNSKSSIGSLLTFKQQKQQEDTKKSDQQNKKSKEIVCRTSRNQTSENQTYDSLYERSKFTNQKRQVLQQKVMQEEGCNFSPKICQKSKYMTSQKPQQSRVAKRISRNVVYYESVDNL